MGEYDESLCQDCRWVGAAAFSPFGHRCGNFGAVDRGGEKESELTFIAGAQTFGGQKTLNLLEAAFKKRFGLNMKIRFAAGFDSFLSVRRG